MKNKTLHLKSILLAIAVQCMFANLIFAQFTQTAPGPNRFGQTFLGNNNTTIRSIGIGNFSQLNDYPRAAFHINANYINYQSLMFNAGDVFRTTGSSTIENNWKLFTGTGQGTEKFSLLVPANSNNVTLQATQNGSMFFNTNSVNRLCIKADGKITINSLSSGTFSLVLSDRNGTLTTHSINGYVIASKRIIELETRVAALEQNLAEMIKNSSSN